RRGAAPSGRRPRCSTGPARRRWPRRTGAAPRERHPRSTAELQLGPADASPIPPVDRRRCCDLAAVEVGAVGRAHVLEEELPVSAEDPGVDLTGVRVAEDDVALAAAPQDQLLAEVEDLGLLTTDQQHHFVGRLAGPSPGGGG